MLSQSGCLARQQRLRLVLEANQLDAALITDPREVYYLTGLPFSDILLDPSTLVIETNGATWLASGNRSIPAAVDQRAEYIVHVGGTRNIDHQRQMADLVQQQLSGKRYGRLGFQTESTPRAIADAMAATVAPDTWVAIDDLLAEMQRAKDPDEIECMRFAIACDLAAYDAAQMAIAPGVSELVVLSAGQRSANLRAGKQVMHSGDYQAGEMGGPARDKALNPDDLYVIDAWVHADGYWADLSRTFAIERITSLQAEIYQHIADILTEVEAHLAPGMPGTELWAWIDSRMREHPHLREAGLGHHAGHGIGLRAHEWPDLNQFRGPELRVGDVVAVEPGSYTADLRPGFRLENMFLITENGCENLSPYPLSLERFI